MDSNSLQQALKLLVGFRFNPTDQILMEHYLYNKIHSLLYSTLVVFYCDLYGDLEPWKIWNSYGGVDGQDLYFFTKLKRSINSSGQLSVHVNRKIGLAGGTGRGEKSTTPISGSNVPIIGYCRRLRYENSQLLEHHGEWIMHEYSLHESVITCGYSDPKYVLCRIRKNEGPKRKALGICNIQPTKKRVLAPEIHDTRKINQRRPTRKANKILLEQLGEQSVVTPNMVCHMACDPKMTTNQIPHDVSYLALTTTEKGIGDMPQPEMTINQITSDMPYAQNMNIMPHMPEITTNTMETNDEIQWSEVLSFDFNEEDIENTKYHIQQI
ncbi:NAC domain-containing protein 96-like [Benincasa hispida]|uniref:NAC domain-containing protein 96-like n=1 Tax=Benincasa hispida TaxID=102211 RepID=UPI0018FF69C3|nr:NAC domain-containing protein 96-like [Benincasa hispida]